MNNYIKFILSLLFASTFFISTSNASSNIIPNKVDIDLENTQSLKKGAKIFFNKCQGCHSLKYIRYIDLASGIGLTETAEKPLIKVIQETLMHSSVNINEHSTIESSIKKNTGVKWFGKIPPDLSLIARYRGNNWLYTYLKSFYVDKSKPWGANNLMFPDTGMPHVLHKLQGTQVLKQNIKNNLNNSEELLELIEEGDLSKEEYNNLVKDLVTFLSYVGEPTQIERRNIGYWVLPFLFILTIFMFFLKREYWKDIK